ncbi:MAG: VWA domain-containing protein [Anaerolineae bacterium]|nr:VWA domain-containing protein [Anaerolineae bacterium]
MKKKRIPIVLSALLLVALTQIPAGGLLGPAVPALADGLIIPAPPPDMPVVDVPYLTVQYHRVTVTIDNQVATTRVDQVFVNEGRHEVEGTYIFPLPEEAAIGEFTMWVDGQKMAGQVLQRDEARRIYEEIVRRRRDPALLEYVGRDAFQASIYPIPPGGERRIEIEYSQVLEVDNGLVEYVYPLNTERFSARPLEEVSVNVTVKSGQALKAIYSPSHEVDVVRDGDSRARIGYEEYNVRPDRDFVLYYTVSAEDVGLNVMSYRPNGRGEGFFLLLAAPKVEIDARNVIAKDVILVLDVSGSMRGQKIEQAKAALGFVLDNLNDGDRFNIIAFSTGTRAYSRGLVGAEERGEARDFVARLEAAGSTDINRALLEAAAMVDAERPSILIFLTDGLPTMGETDVNRIIDNAGDAAPENVRIFPFGVGYDVNTFLLDTIAQNHRGASGYVKPEEAIDEKVSAFYAKVSTPLLSDIAIDWGGMEVDDVYPYPLPDLFAGTQLAVAGRYRGGGEATIQLSGRVNGELQKFIYAGVVFEEEGGRDFIARLWATRKIGTLLQQIRLHGEEAELVDEIVELSIRYGIITPYTSFLVEETEMALSEAGRQGLADAVAAQATAAPAVGGEAVQRSEAEKALSLSQAPAAAAMPTQMVEMAGARDQYGNLVSPVKYVGDKTFIYDAGTWTDTTFDADRMTPTPVGFGSEDYFALAASRPEWGRYLAVGDHVIVVLDGAAYEVREGEAPPLGIPAATPAAGPQDRDSAGPRDRDISLVEAMIRMVVELVRSIMGQIEGR